LILVASYLLALGTAPPSLFSDEAAFGHHGWAISLAMMADTTGGSLGYSRFLRLANDGDAAAAEEESALVPVLPTYAVVDPFADPQHLKDLSLTGGLPGPLRLENHPISDLALNHHRTSL
jgi:hypothetical protein